MSSEIKVDTISEQTSANGVAIDSLGIKDGKITNLMNATLSAADLGNVHIKVADSGASSNNDADELVLEQNGACGINILSANNSQGNIFFGDDGDNDIGRIINNQNNNRMSFRANATEGLAINADGEVTKPLQPCFRVGSGTQNNISVSTNNNAVFDVEIFDIGNNFASSTFTAPVTGKYFFTVSFRMGNLDSAASYLQTVLVGSNRNSTLHTLSVIGNHIDADTEYSHTGTAILDMDANDTALARIRIQSGTAQTDVDTDGSYFSGFLIG